MKRIQTRWSLAADPDIPVDVLRRRAAQRRGMDRLVARADQALYRARIKRNMVVAD
jgi:hypothetical protein